MNDNVTEPAGHPDNPVFADGARSLDGLVLCPCCGNGKPDDGEELCEKCHYDLIAEQESRNMVQVTREMAHDGGCLEMEGAWIEW